MLIKKADDASALLADLEARSRGTGDEARRATEELRIRRAGLRGEAESAYLIDFEFGSNANWAVLHDLRIEQAGRVAQVDHLLINRFLEIYVLESKHFHAGLKITEDGEFLRWNDFKKAYEGMASPVEQNDRHIKVLKDVIATIELPTRLGLRLNPGFYSFVLVSPNSRIDRPRKFDSSRVIKADQLRKAIWKDIDNENSAVTLLKATRIVSAETVQTIGKRLAAQHKPLVRESTPHSSPRPAALEPPKLPPTSLPTEVSSPSPPPGEGQTDPAFGPRCKKCSGTAGAILYGKFGYYFSCPGCGTNTSIRFSCNAGHSPRLRKAGSTFYRECADCGTSELYYTNA
jgi:hypothetical protein